MLAKPMRLNAYGIDKLFKKGQKITQKHFTLRYLPNTLNHSRFGVILSKKTLKLSTSRNFSRRQIYQICRLRPPASALDILIQLKSDPSQLSYQQLESNLTDSFVKISNKNPFHEQ